MMSKEFIPYELALKLKELGFNEECLAVWDNQTKELFMNDTRELNVNQIPSIFTLAPLWQQAFEFFRINHNLSGEIYCLRNGWHFDVRNTIENKDESSSDQEYRTYEEARIKCLNKLIEIEK